MLNPEQIQVMSTAERMEAIEQLWESLRDDEDQVQSPQWHGHVLAERLRRAESGQARFLTLEQLAARLKRLK